jgi:hypothetical protein
LLRTRLEALRQLTHRKRSVRLRWIELGDVEHAKQDGVNPQLFRHFVHGDFKRHHAGRLAGRAHCVALREVQHGQTQVGHAVRAGIQQAGRRGGGLGATAPQVARPALVTDGRDLAVAGCADAQPLNRRRPVRRAVENQGRVSATFTGRPTARAASAADTVSASTVPLPPKPPPM